MSGDKRSVATDALETLGTIIDKTAGRDAIHLAVEPVVAAQKLYPGQDVGFVEGGAGPCDSPLGIVDPFLKGPVFPGQRFWLIVYPRQITSLRHVWSHPAFPDEQPTADQKERSERWLRNFCDNADCPDYEIVVAIAAGLPVPEVGDYGKAGENCGDYLLIRGRDAHGDIPPEFWDHVEVVTGKKIDPDYRASYFSCTC